MTGWWFGTFFIFPYIGNNHFNWLSYFSEGFKPTRWFQDALLHIERDDLKVAMFGCCRCFLMVDTCEKTPGFLKLSFSVVKLPNVWTEWVYHRDVVVHIYIKPYDTHWYTLLSFFMALENGPFIDVSNIYVITKKQTIISWNYLVNKIVYLLYNVCFFGRVTLNNQRLSSHFWLTWTPRWWSVSFLFNMFVEAPPLQSHVFGQVWIGVHLQLFSVTVSTWLKRGYSFLE